MKENYWKMSNTSENPYAKAAGTYDNHAQAHTTNQRELEGRVLLKANRRFQDILNNWDNRAKNALGDALTYNRQIWVLFYDTAIENKDGGRPNDLRSNIVNLANYTFKREMEILADPKPEKLNVLININSEIAAGLMVNNEKTAPTPRPPEQAPEPSGSHTDISG